MIFAVSTATKEMENPEQTAEMVAISALIVQVNCCSALEALFLLNLYLFFILICTTNVFS